MITRPYFKFFLQELLREVDAKPWQGLAKRRVQHYGYEFLYKVLKIPLSSVGFSFHLSVLKLQERVMQLNTF